MITNDEINMVSREIIEKFFPDKIVLFGSYAYGNPSSNSDLDLLVILPFVGKNFYKSLEIYQSLSVTFPIDILARTPDDTEKRFRLGDPLIRDAMNKGKILYERNR
jgi:predicted nucleotidyltransferase